MYIEICNVCSWKGGGGSLRLGNIKSSKVSNLRQQSAWSIDGTQKQTQK
jgi:hypothetical protein